MVFCGIPLLVGPWTESFSLSPGVRVALEGVCGGFLITWQPGSSERANEKREGEQMRSHSPLQPALEIISHQFLCYPISCTRFSPHSRRRTHLRSCLPHKKLESDHSGASLVVQWLRLHCPVKRVWVQHLVRKLRPHTPCSRKTTA